MSFMQGLFQQPNQRSLACWYSGSLAASPLGGRGHGEGCPEWDFPSQVGAVIMANIAFEKRVSARFTIDNWKAVSEVPAEFKRPANVLGKFQGYGRHHRGHGGRRGHGNFQPSSGRSPLRSPLRSWSSQRPQEIQPRLRRPSWRLPRTVTEVTEDPKQVRGGRHYGHGGP